MGEKAPNQTLKSDAVVVSVTNDGNDKKILEIVITSDSQCRSVLRSYEEFQLFYCKIQEKLAESAEKLPECPDFSQQHSDSELVSLCNAFNQILALDAIKECEEYNSFILENCSEASDWKISAIDFVLQPFQYQRMYVGRGSFYEMQVNVDEVNDVVLWKFEVEDHDIEFSVIFKADVISSDENSPDVVVHSATKYENTSALKPVEGMYECQSEGKIILRWDNTYSRIRGKNILLLCEKVSNETYKSALVAADAFAEASARQKGVNLSGNCLRTKSLPEKESESYNFLEYGSYVADTGNWFIHGTAKVAEQAASRIFGSSFNSNVLSDSSLSLSEASLMEELNGLNMALLQRVESLEDNLAQKTAEKDQALSQVHLAKLERESANAQLFEKDSECISLQSELDRFSRERQAWGKVESERNLLLLEKHRWDTQNELDLENDDSKNIEHMDIESRKKLEKELENAERVIIQTRVKLGYSGQNRYINNSTRLEKLTEELKESQILHEEKVHNMGEEIKLLKQQVLKFKSQKKVLVTELRNLKRQSEGQISVAMAEASESRMVNRRLRHQNELLLKQIRSSTNNEEPISHAEKAKLESVPYTLKEKDIAILNGSKSEKKDVTSLVEVNKFRSRLVDFLNQYDPSRVNEVDILLETYKGVEDALFQSLELKYCFNKIDVH